LVAVLLTKETAQLCDRVLVHEQGFSDEETLARTPSGQFNQAYLAKVGINGERLQRKLLQLHRKLWNAREDLMSAVSNILVSGSEAVW
jgi:hypothetical protein